MSAVGLWDAGFTELVSVIPPGATLSRHSSIRPEVLGKIPGKHGRDGWHGYSFLKATPPSRPEVIQWDEWGANVGILGAHYPGVDIDTNSLALARHAEELAKDILGYAPRRFSRSPRALLMYRATEPFARMAVIGKLPYEDGAHLIEVLGVGRQYLIAGTHPSGSQYHWDTPLEELTPESLTFITQENVEQFLDAVEATMRNAGMVVERLGRGNAPLPVSQMSLQGPGGEQLKRVVRAIPNDTRFRERDTYIAFGHALKAAGGDSYGDVAFQLWQEFAGRWQEGDNDPDIVKRDWDGFRPPYRVGWDRLVELAEDSGWVSAQYEFPDLVVPLPESSHVDRSVPHTFMLVSDLVQHPELLAPPQAIIPRLAYRGRLLMLAASDKLGKSTLMAHAATALSLGEPFLEEPLQEGRTLWVGLEEAVNDSVRRFHDLGAKGEHIMHVVTRPKSIMKQAGVLLESWPADLVVIDSLQEFARVTLGSAPDDGSNAGWANVVRPISEFAREHDTAVVLLHHVRRSDGQYRGAGDSAAAVDALLEMRGPHNTEDYRVRHLSGRGRWSVTPFSVALRDGVYELVGAISIDFDQRIVQAVLESPGISIAELRKTIGGKTSHVTDAVARLTAQGVIENRGRVNRSELFVGDAQIDFSEFIQPEGHI